MLEFDIEERCDLDCPERDLIAAALRLWVADILHSACSEGDEYQRFKRWDQHGIPPRFRQWCGLLELDVEAVVKALWYRIAEQRDTPKRTRQPSQAQLADHRRPMACASQRTDPLAIRCEEVEARLQARAITGLHYYNGDTHQAVLALPNFVRQLLP